MKYGLSLIYRAMFNDIAEGIKSTKVERDLETIRSRVEKEGISFVTITLPAFSKAIILAVEEGFFSISDLPGFKRQKGSCLPRFLSGYTEKIFNSDGSVKEDFDPDWLFRVRQICDLFKRANLECSDRRKKAAITKFSATDADLSDWTNAARNPDICIRTFIGCVDNFRRAVVLPLDRSGLKPRHGSGATAERKTRNKRRCFTEWPIRFEPYFPLSIHAIPNIGWLKEARRIKYLKDSELQPSRLALVPKTLETPRIIAIEPSYAMYAQQGIKEWLQPRLENHPITRDAINFSSQSINQEMAVLSSMFPFYGTIDLSEASDRVQNSLVEFVYGESFLGSAMQACRSEFVQLPCGNTMKLRKYATAGNATTFPVEASIFYLIIQSAIHAYEGIRPTLGTMRRISRRIRIYGDDIIVPSIHFGVVSNYLEAFGLKVNRKKSFNNSYFRESCGADYYKGIDVKPVYLQVDPNFLDTRLSATDWLSLCSKSNQFYMKGLWHVTQLLRDKVTSSSKYDVPFRSDKELTGPVFYSCFRNTYSHWDKRYQRFRSRSLVARPVKMLDDVTKNNVAKITLALENIGGLLPVDLEQSAKPHAFGLKRGWVN